MLNYFFSLSLYLAENALCLNCKIVFSPSTRNSQKTQAYVSLYHNHVKRGVTQSHNGTTDRNITVLLVIKPIDGIIIIPVSAY